jgi:hypothetical protein
MRLGGRLAEEKVVARAVLGEPVSVRFPDKQGKNSVCIEIRTEAAALALDKSLKSQSEFRKFLTPKNSEKSFADQGDDFKE